MTHQIIMSDELSDAALSKVSGGRHAAAQTASAPSATMHAQARPQGNSLHATGNSVAIRPEPVRPPVGIRLSV